MRAVYRVGIPMSQKFCVQLKKFMLVLESYFLSHMLIDNLSSIPRPTHLVLLLNVMLIDA